MIPICRRYYLEKENELLRQYGDIASRTPVRQTFLKKKPYGLIRMGEVRPNSLVTVLATSKQGHKACFPMVWGYNIQDRPPLPNARSETAAQKPIFHDGWSSHRCVVPASWYYEWEHLRRNDGRMEAGEKYLIQPKGDRITWMCGLYCFEKGLPHFLILTRAAAEEIHFIHDRMPLMIREEDVDEWISPDAKPEEIASRAITDLYYEKAPVMKEPTLSEQLGLI